MSKAGNRDNILDQRSVRARNKWLILRRLTQLLILGLFLIGPWFGIWFIKGTLTSSLILDTVPLIDPLVTLQLLVTVGSLTATTLIGTAIVVIFYIIIGGRVFCSWACPINPITDTAHWLRNHFTLKGSVKLPRNLRYWVLAMIMAVAAITGTVAWEFVNPVSLLHRGLFFGIGLGWTVIVGIFFFDLLFAERGWCTHLCPMGSLYALIGYVSPLRIHSKPDQCDDCGICYFVCPEPHVIPSSLKKDTSRNYITNAECTNCGRCIDRCPQAVFSFGLKTSVISTDRNAKQ
jgi:ferredoxin-type protein NapH